MSALPPMLRTTAAALALWSLALAVPVTAAPSWATPAPAISALAVDSVAMSVSDLDRSVAFYVNVLDFERVSEQETAGAEVEAAEGVFGVRLRTARLRLGDEFIELREFLAPRGRAVPADSRSNDRWFQHVAIIVSDMERAYQHLRKHRVEHASSGPQRLPDWNPAAGGISAFYFKDPDGHPLEVLHFPAGKGDAKWHRPTDRLFLGIDHTAIVVSSTEQSLGFWRDALGLRVAGDSENHGTEQEQLNAVFGARLRITGLRAPGGPGIEFLEYLAPRTGRPLPEGLATNDLVSTVTQLTVPDAEAAARLLVQRGYSWASPGAVSLKGTDASAAVRVTNADTAVRSTDADTAVRSTDADPAVRVNGADASVRATTADAAIRRVLLVRDPDGHLVKLIEKD